MYSSDIKNRMINGTGTGSILTGGGQQINSGHYIDSLERFQKDFAAYDKIKREQQRKRRTLEIERRRDGIVNREEKRINYMDDQYLREKERRDRALNEEQLRIKKRANLTSLPYNPITLQYQSSIPGSNLKRQDEDNQIRNLVRAHNIDNHGNSRFNPVTGQQRLAIQKLVPEDLGNRFNSRLDQHYEGYKIKLPESNLISRRISKSVYDK